MGDASHPVVIASSLVGDASSRRHTCWPPSFECYSNSRVESVKSYIVVFKPLIVLMAWFIFDILSENRETALFASSMVLTTSFVEEL